MDETSKIAFIMEPVRSLVLAGGSMKQNRNAFVIVHVKNYIVEERRELLREAKILLQQNTRDENLYANGSEVTAQEPAAEQDPAVQEPAAQEPAAEQDPAVQEPAAQETAAEQDPAVQEPAAQEPAAEQDPAIQEPAAQEPAAYQDLTEQEPATRGRLSLDKQAAEFAVHDWEEQAADLIRLINENKENDILRALDAALNLQSVCMESIIFCLVLVIKKTNNVEMVTQGYSKVPLYCKTTEMLMLFIEYFKIYNIAAGTKSGWGRGFKKAIRNWYQKFTAKELALEMTRHPHAYSWSHRDVLKMAHIKLDDVGFGREVVLHYIFSGYESAREVYGGEPRAAEIFGFLKTLHDGAKEVSNHEVIVARGNDIKTEFLSITLRDFPMQAINSIQVMTFLVEEGDENLIIDMLVNSRLMKYVYTNDALYQLLKSRLNLGSFYKNVDAFKVAFAFNATRRLVSEFSRYNVADLNPLTLKRKPWMKFAQPNADRARKPKTPHPRQKEMDDLSKALSKNITKGTQPMSENADLSPIVFIDFAKVLDVYIQADPANLVSKQLRGTQAISYLLLILLKRSTRGQSPGGPRAPIPPIGTLIPTCKEAIDKFQTQNTPLCFDTLITALNGAIKNASNTSKVDVKLCLETTIDMGGTTALLIYAKLTAEILESIISIFEEVEKSNLKENLRVIALGLDAPIQTATVQPYDANKILLLHGFNQYTTPVIQAFTNGLL